MSATSPTEDPRQDFARNPAVTCAFRLVLLLWFVFTGLSVRAQEAGSVSGVVVSSWDGAPLAGVTVSVRGTTLAVQTDANGRYQINNVPPGDQTLRFSKSGFAAANVSNARVLLGQTTTVNGNLRPEFYEMEEYEVTAEEFSEQTEKILIERQKSSSMIESLGSDFLSRVGAGNAAESITKVSGATIVEGKFAVIRGLNDRYVGTTLNGASIPSADPYRQTASLDLFPSQVIDQVVVTKTFTPDQPGAFTGGGIDIVTKSFPEKQFVSVSLGAAYNEQANLNDHYLTYKGSGTDWAGMDDGSRALPDFVKANLPVTPTPAGALEGALIGNVPTNRQAGQFLLDKVTKAFGVTEFAPHQEAAPLNHNFSAAGGGSVPVGQGLFGWFVGGNYKHDYNFYEDGISRRYSGGNPDVNNTDGDFTDTRAQSIVNWSGMVNLGYKPFENHELGFTFFYNQNGIDEARVQEGTDTYTQGVLFRKYALYWTERNLNSYQMRGKHVFPAVNDLEFDWLVALTSTTQDEPDARFFNDADTGGGPQTGLAFIPTPSNPTRYFRNLEEENQNVKLDWTLPFENWTDEQAKFKFGLFGSYSQRDFYERQFYYTRGPGYDGDPNHYLTPDNIGAGVLTTNATSKAINYHWGRVLGSFDSVYDGTLDIEAGYLMTELPLLNKLRLVGGARYEMTDYRVNSISYIASSETSLNTNHTVIVQNDLLPAVGLIYEVTPRMNFRVNYSQTVARPSFRELAAYRGYDPIINDFIEGNPNLEMTSIENYDFRWEWFPNPGELLSVSLFYKDLKNPIERGNRTVDGSVITYFNRPEAKIYGVELEARKNLGFLGRPFKPFSIGGNGSLVESETDLTPLELANKSPFFPNGLDTSRPLYDQSPYILNLDLTFNQTRWGTTASVVYNIAGPRIIITKLNAQDVYEQPTPTLDFILSQKMTGNFTLKFTAKNILNPEFKRTYGKDSDLIYSSYKKGITFGMSLSCDF